MRKEKKKRKGQEAKIKKKSFFKNRKEIFFLVMSFITSVIFFVWQKKFFSWDFSVYLMNAEYIFKDFYFEWLRAPFASWIMAVLIPLGRQFAIHSFVVIVSLFYFFALKLFHDRFLIKYRNSEFFYLLAINPFILGFGLQMGTELLSISLIILFLAFAFSCPSVIFLSLSMLTRYSNILLLPLIFFQKNIKRVFLGLLIISLIFMPWFIVNYLGTGHALTSLGDYYTLNVLEQAKSQLELKKFLSDLLVVFNMLIPFIIIGILNLIKRWNNLGDKEKVLIYLLIVVSLLTILTYLFNSLKDPRYMFNLALPAVYFSFLGLNFIIEKIRIKELKKAIRYFLIIFLIFLAISTFYIMQEKIGNEDKLEQTKEIIQKIDNNCTISSDLWVYFDWHGKKAIPPPFALYSQNESQASSMVNEGYNLILFKPGEAYQKNLPLIQVLNESIKEDNKNYIWLYNNSACKQLDKINQTYIGSLKEVGEFTQDFSGCDALFLRLKLTKICQIFPFL